LKRFVRAEIGKLVENPDIMAIIGILADSLPAQVGPQMLCKLSIS
jgi:hypothetical protein